MNQKTRMIFGSFLAVSTMFDVGSEQKFHTENREKQSMNTLFLSHRGESDDAPENTIPAFLLAAERKSDGVELDIHMTKDRKIIVCHDGSLKRVAGADLKIADHTLEELRKVHPVPELKEVFEVLQPGCMIQIELKGKQKMLPEFAKLLTPEIRKKFRITISSFSGKLLKDAAKFSPDLPRILLVDYQIAFKGIPTPEELTSHLKKFDATGVSLKADRQIDAEYVQKLKSAGFTVVAWGVSNDDLGFHMAQIGVQAMTCNHAVALRTVWQERTVKEGYSQ